MPGEIIRLEKISKKYGNKEIFTSFSASFYQGVYNCIYGPSGSGKTTLLRIIMGLDRVDGGRLIGTDRVFSCLFQENRLLDYLTGLENVLLVRPDLAREDLVEDFCRLGLDSSIDKEAGTYSGGMKRRLALLRALVADYEVLVLDEPFKELDLETYKKTLGYFEEKTRGRTVILTSHSPYELAKFGDNKIQII